MQRYPMAEIVRFAKARKTVVIERDEDLGDDEYEIRDERPGFARVAGSRKGIARLAVGAAGHGGKYTGNLDAEAVKEAVSGALDPVQIGRGVIFHSS